jgi:hypothetical protein
MHKVKVLYTLMRCSGIDSMLRIPSLSRTPFSRVSCNIPSLSMKERGGSSGSETLDALRVRAGDWEASKEALRLPAMDERESCKIEVQKGVRRCAEKWSLCVGGLEPLRSREVYVWERNTSRVRE